MRLVKSYKDSSTAVFCAFELDLPIRNRTFIKVVDLDSKDSILAMKKRFVVDHLEYISESEGDVSWADLDTEISSIMRAKFHII